MRKKIAVFMGEITGSFQEVAVRCITERANALNYDVAVICTFGSYNDDFIYAEGEKAGIYLPDISIFDGVIVTEDVFDIEGMADEFYNHMKMHAKCPVVYLRTQRDGFYSLENENKEAMVTMTRHFVETHGFTDICFMGGKRESADAKQRLKGFLDVMAEHNLPVNEHMVFHGDYWREKGREAMDWFMEGRTTYPQAIICANDYMALAICEELTHRGVRIPEDVCVSGYDYVTEARRYYPTLTSLEIDFEDMAKRAVDIIDKANRGEPQPLHHKVVPQLRLHASCGCGCQLKGDEQIDIAIRNKNYTVSMKRFMMSLTEYQDSFDEEEYLWVAEKYSDLIQSDKIYVCLCDEKEVGYNEVEKDNAFSDRMILKRVLHQGENSERPNIYFDRKDLLPKSVWEQRKAQNYLFFTIHFKNKVFGYLATDFPKDCWFDIFVQPYIMNLANAMESASVQKALTGLEEIRALYQKDALTGLLNRRGFDKQLRDALVKAKNDDNVLYIVSIDMDGLKQINDTYGHIEGDNALSKLGAVLQGVLEEGEFCARIGGDEFAAFLIGNDADRTDRFQSAFERALASVMDVDMHYSLKASVGICALNEEPDATLSSCIQKADMRMYENKRQHKSAEQAQEASDVRGSGKTYFGKSIRS